MIGLFVWIRLFLRVEYDVVFTSPVTNVRLDGAPVELDRQGFFSFDSFQSADEVRRLRYINAGGKSVEMALYPREDDRGQSLLAISDLKIEGRPRHREIPASSSSEQSASEG